MAICIHGGGFILGDHRKVAEIALLRYNGCSAAIVSIDYRLTAGCAPATSECAQGIDMAYHDAQAAVRFLRANAATYRVDPNRIAIGGSSAARRGPLPPSPASSAASASSSRRA